MEEEHFVFSLNLVSVRHRTRNKNPITEVKYYAMFSSVDAVTKVLQNISYKSKTSLPQIILHIQ